MAARGADQVGTPVVQLNASGTPELVALKLPYGAGRYAAASLANLGFTGQRKDTSPNLTYFNARFYDQDVGVFLSPDSVRDGPNPYAYVGGMVENATDPSGHEMCEAECEAGGGAPEWASVDIAAVEGSVESVAGSGPAVVDDISTETTTEVVNSDGSITFSDNTEIANTSYGDTTDGELNVYRGEHPAEPPAETPPTETPPTETPPTETPPSEAPPNEAPPTETPPT